MVKKTNELFSNTEMQILQKYRSWTVVSENDVIVLNRYAGVGFVQFGFDWDNMLETAKLTDSGLNHLDRFR